MCLVKTVIDPGENKDCEKVTMTVVRTIGEWTVVDSNIFNGSVKSLVDVLRPLNLKIVGSSFGSE